MAAPLASVMRPLSARLNVGHLLQARENDGGVYSQSSFSLVQSTMCSDRSASEHTCSVHKARRECCSRILLLGPSTEEFRNQPEFQNRPLKYIWFVRQYSSNAIAFSGENLWQGWMYE